ncbi:serine/threonine-protein phosphatase PGAM5, mitochondrial [Copidosoma floridanum]|uniref:serine/threonine-protein phosphatase PGAM5, mitochondrial n=1 Tax=Copidosoma floridanum TaxID=29053 RepID=UPI0006C9B29B|nr:serine/threonine-protein phosphatase PGAM5, mitochondrial [Copidosoma floridanum]
MAHFSRLQKFSLFSVGLLTVNSFFFIKYRDEFFIFRLVASNMKYNSFVTKWDHNWDRHVPEKLSNFINIDKPESSKYNGKVANHILLIRHGQYHVNKHNDDERRLTELGKLQAEITGLRLAELAVPYKKIVSSTMMRAQETSRLIQNHLPLVEIIEDCLLVEGYPIAPDPPGGRWRPEKKFFQDGPRLEAAFRKYIHRADSLVEKDNYTVIVCHANVIRYFVCRALQIPPEAWLRMSLNHGSVTWITVLSSGKVILRSFGETSHMLPEWITSR